MKKYGPYILIGILLIAFGFLIYYLWQSAKPTPVQNQPPAQTDWLTGLISGAASLIKGWLGGSSGSSEPAVVNCDPNHPGYETDGTKNSNCGKDYTGCDSNKCDPARSGFNECGFLDIICF